MIDNTVSLILSFLETKKTKLFTTVRISEYNGNLQHTALFFCYAGYDIEIAIYNENFMTVKLDNQPYAFCENLENIRQTIYNIDNLFYETGHVYQ